MRMDVSLALKNPGHEFPFALELPLRDQEFAGEAIEFKSDARLEGTYAMQGAGVVVRGELSVKLSRQCSKCLGPVDTAVECEFEDMFFKEPDPDEPNELHDRHVRLCGEPGVSRAADDRAVQSRL